MKRRLVFRPEAAADVHSIYKWYEEQRPGLGAEFEEALNRVQRIV